MVVAAPKTWPFDFGTDEDTVVIGAGVSGVLADWNETETDATSTFAVDIG